MALEKMNRDEAGHSIGRQASKDSGDRRFEPSQRQSFHWVDNDGYAQRLEGTSDAIRDLTGRPEIWVCIADHDVPYQSGPTNDADTTGKYCKVGEKINAVKEDDWLHVLQVTSQWDPASVLGHRSLHNITKMVVEDTGMYLPMSDNGQKLFKSYKVYLFEESAKMDNPASAPPAKEEGGNCALM